MTNTITCLLLLAVTVAAGENPYIRLIQHQNKQRMNAGVDKNNYQLLPLVLKNHPQHIVTLPETDQLIHVQVKVLWLINNSLVFPKFHLSEKVTVTIQQMGSSTPAPKNILKRELLTQTGFRVELERNRQYRWKVESLGKEIKIVQIATSSTVKAKEEQQQKEGSRQKRYGRVLEQMVSVLERARRVRTHSRDINFEEEVDSLWMWVGTMQILTVLAFLLLQLAFFQRVKLPTSVI